MPPAGLFPFSSARPAATPSGFANSRAQSMNNRVTGLIVRFFMVMIPTGNGGMGNSTGKILSGGRFAPKRNKESGKIPEKARLRPGGPSPSPSLLVEI